MIGRSTMASRRFVRRATGPRSGMSNSSALLRRGAIEVARLLVAAVAGLLAFFLIFWLSALVFGNRELGVWVALLLGFVGAPALVLRAWRVPAGNRHVLEPEEAE